MDHWEANDQRLHPRMSDCGCGNAIETETLERRQRRVLAAVLVINLATFVMMLAASVLSGSVALLTPRRNDDVNMASVWECSRNDIFDGVAVIVAAVAVWLFESGWPDLLIAAGLVVLFLRSALRVVRNALEELGHLHAHPSA